LRRTMIIVSSSEIEDKLNVPNIVPSNASSLSLRSAPPVHPAIQYGIGISPVSPPGYAAARKPPSSIVYSFWPQTIPPNSMILSPPPNIPDPHPSYYISVNLNCFTPTSFITTLRRGSWDGDAVGDFEMGLTSSKKGLVCIRGNERPLSEVLDTSHRPFRVTWTWKVSDHDKGTYLYWDDSASAGVLTCYSSKDKHPGSYVAKFMPTIHLRKANRKVELNRLEVSPQGHEFFDDIAISALILERLRTTPSV